MKNIIFVALISIAALYPAEDEKRNYNFIVHDDQNIPILKFTCEYIGKEPRGEFVYKDLSYRSLSCDFYNYYYENLTDYQITFIRCSRYHKVPKDGMFCRKLPDGTTVLDKFPPIQDIDYKQKPRRKGNIIPAHSTQIKENTFYCTDTDNVQFQVETIEYREKYYKFTTYKIYRKGID